MKTTYMTLAVCSALFSANIHAQSFPAKAVRVVVANTAGSTEDAVARILCNELTATKWKQGCVVENRPGGGGFIGAQAVARSSPDGYTLFMGSAGVMAVNPHLYENIPYDALQDFAPISLVGSYPYTLVVGPERGISSLSDLVEAAKKSDRLMYAAYGPGSLTNISPQMLKAESGVPFEYVYYKGSSDALPNVSAGEIDLMFESPAIVEGFVKSGRLIALAVTSKDRVKAFHDVPTFRELGYKSLDVTQWSALFAPADTPQQVLSKIVQDVSEALQVTEVRQRMSDVGIEPTTVPAEDTAAFHREQYDKFGKVIKDMGIRIE